VPDQLVGSVLYPLNELRAHAPDAWQRELLKYEGRPSVRELRVPPLDCLWNDVLHFGTVHPARIVAALEAAGVEPTRRRFFAVEAATLDVDRTVIFLNRRDEGRPRMDDAQWLPFEGTLPPKLAQLNEATRRYYRECASDGTRPRLYACLPHVLHRGPLETRGLPVVEV